MPYIMVMGSLSAQLSKDDVVTVYGLKSDERAVLVRELNTSYGTISFASDLERMVRVTLKGMTLVVVNRIHGLFGYDVVSHSMAMTNANRELLSFTMYKKTSNSHEHAQSSRHKSSPNHGHARSSSPKSHGHGNVVTL